VFTIRFHELLAEPATQVDGVVEFLNCSFARSNMERQSQWPNYSVGVSDRTKSPGSSLP